jgi:hypothetical protein
MARSAKRSGGGGEIDAIKAFIVIMAVLTVGLAIFSFLHLKSRLGDLDRANAMAKKQCERIIRLRREIFRYLTAYEKARESGGIASPEEYFDRVCNMSGIPSSSMTPQFDRESTRTRGEYREIYTQIELRDVTWDQVIKFMWYVEHQSPKYRILQIDSLQRVDQRSENDLWKTTFRAAYRTQVK